MAYDKSYDRSKNMSKQKLNVNDPSEWVVAQDDWGQVGQYDWGQVGQDDWGDGSCDWVEGEKCEEDQNIDEDQEFDELAETSSHLENLEHCQQNLSTENLTAVNNGQAIAIDNLNSFSEVQHSV